MIGRVPAKRFPEKSTSLLPPFDFPLFYLRGVAPPEIQTMEIYRGVIPFMLIQIVALFILARA